MSKLGCRCGNIISDTVYPCPTEGDLTGQQDNERLQDESIKAVGSFVAALLGGRREEWIRTFFLSGYPQDISDESVISDILSTFDMRYRKSIAECDRCGRLWVQMRAGANEYRSYVPDEGGYAEVLRGGPEVRDNQPLQWTGPAERSSEE